MRVAIIPSEEASDRLSQVVYEYLSLKGKIVFPASDRAKPAQNVLIVGSSVSVRVERDQYEKCVRPVLEKESLQVLRTPRAREILRANSRKDYFINLIGGYLKESFETGGY